MRGFQDFRRSIASVRLMVEYCLELDLAVPDLLADSEISPVMLSEPQTEITAGQELQVIRNMLAYFDEPERHALAIGRRYHFSAYGLWGYGLICSATAGDALELALKFLPLTYAFSVITYREEQGTGILDFGEPDLAPSLARFVVARDMAATTVLMQELVGETFYLEQAIRQGAGAGKEPIELLNVPVEYGAAHNRFSFPSAVLSRPLSQANAVTAAFCEQQCRALMEQRRIHAGSAAMVRYCLQSSGAVLPSLAAVARQMHMSERTLKRHLHEEGACFRRIKEAVLRARAEHLLSHTGLGMAEISERLGFSDASTFSQSFKRWTGLAPSHFRRGVKHSAERTPDGPWRQVGAESGPGARSPVPPSGLHP